MMNPEKVGRQLSDDEVRNRLQKYDKWEMCICIPDANDNCFRFYPDFYEIAFCYDELEKIESGRTDRESDMTEKELNENIINMSLNQRKAPYLSREEIKTHATNSKGSTNVFKMYGKDGLQTKIDDHPVYILPSCEKGYHRIWDRDGICARITEEEKQPKKFKPGMTVTPGCQPYIPPTFEIH